MHFVKQFSDINKEDSQSVGIKAANLGEMYNQGFPVPNGFIITQNAYYHFLKENKLDLKIKHVLTTANFNHLRSLHQISTIIKKLIMDANFPNDLIYEIIDSYQKLKEPLVAIKFSKANFSQHPQALLNVKGDAVLLSKIKHVWCSMFDPREILHRHSQGLEQTKAEMTLIIQQMIESEKSGVLYTVNPNNNDKTKVVIKAVLGLGELITENPEEADIYEINKSQLNIVKRFVSSQKRKIVKAETFNKEVTLNPALGKKPKISDTEIIALTKLGIVIEQYCFFPQVIEWAIENNKIFIIQTQPITDIKNIEDPPVTTSNNDLILKGIGANKGIACGPVRIVLSQQDAEKIAPQDVVVIKEIKSSFLNIFKKASAVVVENSNKNIQILFTSNELQLPCVTGIINATTILKQDEIITVNGTSGEVYKGGFSIKPNKYQAPQTERKTATKLFINLKTSNELQNIFPESIDGAFLLDTENIIKKFGVHPKKIITEKRENSFIEELFNYFTNACKTLDLKPVIYQISNLTTDDYLSLDGGSEFEQSEENPNMGLRGAFRHIHDQQSFKLELEAVKKTRNALAFKNLWLLIPFVRTVEELRLIKNIINETGLQRSANFKIFMSIDIPSNIIMLEKFMDEGIDGVFINSSFLSSLLTGTDKNNFEITAENNKYNETLAWTLERIIKTSGKYSIPSFLFNDNLPSAENLLNNLVSWGLSGICVEPQAVDNTRKALIQAEKEYINNRDGKN